MTTGRGTWRLSDLAHEAWRNVTGSGARLRLLVIAYVFLGSLIVSLTALEWLTFRERLGRLVSAGVNVLVVTAVGDSPRSTLLSPATCAPLAEFAGVDGVYAVGERRLMRVEEMGSALVPVVEVGYSSRLALPRQAEGGGGVVALTGSHALPEIRSLRRVTLGGTHYSVKPALPDALEAADLGAALVVPVPLDRMRTPVERCAVIERVPSGVPSLSTLAAAVRAPGGMILVTPVAGDRLAEEVDQFVERPMRHLPFVIGLVAGLMMLVSARSRRSEVAVYRVAGTSRLAMFVLLTLETFLLLGLFAMSMLGGDLALQATTGLPILSSVGHQALAIVALSVLAIGSATWLAATDVVAALKDR